MLSNDENRNKNPQTTKSPIMKSLVEGWTSCWLHLKLDKEGAMDSMKLSSLGAMNLCGLTGRHLNSPLWVQREKHVGHQCGLVGSNWIPGTHPLIQLLITKEGVTLFIVTLSMLVGVGGFIYFAKLKLIGMCPII
jgi:hypothetical protein